MPSSIRRQFDPAAKKITNVATTNGIGISPTQPPLSGLRLLVSVRDVSEARLARLLKIHWIDLKNPDAGSLGAPDAEVAIQVATELGLDLAANQTSPAAPDVVPSPQQSVALGELAELDLNLVDLLGELFPICKVGLARTADANGNLLPQYAQKLDELIERLAPGQIVVAAYADHVRAAAPAVAQVCELAQHATARYLLIDTYVKDGLGLLHWMSPAELIAVRSAVQAIGADLVLAGSLKLGDLPILRELTEFAPVIIAIRGAVCIGDRRGALSDELLQEWVAQLRLSTSRLGSA